MAGTLDVREADIPSINLVMCLENINTATLQKHMHPLNNHKNIYGFLAILKKSQSYEASQHSMLGRHRHASETPWSAFSGILNFDPISPHLPPPPPPPSKKKKKKKKKKSFASWTPSDETLRACTFHGGV